MRGNFALAITEYVFVANLNNLRAAQAAGGLIVAQEPIVIESSSNQKARSMTPPN